jgi:hypothetical protein
MKPLPKKKKPKQQQQKNESVPHGPFIVLMVFLIDILKISLLEIGENMGPARLNIKWTVARPYLTVQL